MRGMNGIAGVIYPDVFQISHWINPLLNMMNPSGANESYSNKNVQIGSAGEKIAFNSQKNSAALFAGHLENREGMLKQLQSHGYQPSTDGEIIVNAYELWGNKAFRRLEGSFSLCILDMAKEKIIVVRDCIGEKPLYWYQDQHHFLFSSSLKALLATGAIPQTAAVDGLSSFLYFGYIPQEMSPIRNVNKLLPGHYLQITLNQVTSIHQYWSYSSHFERKEGPSETAIVQHLDHLLERAAKSLVADHQNVGYLSSSEPGSAIVAHYLEKALQGYAQEIPVQKNLDAHVDPNALIEIAWHLEEPQADQEVLATWNWAKQASSEINVLFTDIGCDEILAIHDRYHVRKHLTESWRSAFNQELTHRFLLPALSALYKPAAFALLKRSRRKPWQFEYLNQNALFDEQAMRQAAPHLASQFDPETFLQKFHNLSKIKSKIGSFVYFDVKTRLPDLTIARYDRLMGAYGIRYCSPFLNRPLIEYFAGLPAGEGKAYLQALLPGAMQGNKQRINVKEDSPFFQLFPLLKKGALIEAGILSEKWLKEALTTPKEHYRQLWGLFFLEVWHRLFINRPMETAPPTLSLKELLLEI